MADAKFVKLFLSCETRAEAEKIAQALLEQRLVACVRFAETDCSYWWKGEIVDAHETVMTMATVAENFATIETEVEKMHTYDTFVLQQLPIERLSKKAAAWLLEELSSSAV
jgi:periplasmic divalent cation tolerance protein